MTGTSVLALLGALVVLAAIPSLSVLVVATRSATLGFHHGALTTLGIVVGDCVFIAIALGGPFSIDDRPRYLGGADQAAGGGRIWFFWGFVCCDLGVGIPKF
jgi:threonine/homoserine/homoserine lactone efflux protein